jgi:hypothetical protein
MRAIGGRDECRVTPASPAIPPGGTPTRGRGRGWGMPVLSVNAYGLDAVCDESGALLRRVPWQTPSRREPAGYVAASASISRLIR